MGFLDDMANAVDRGTAAVGRTTKSAQLKMQLSNLEKQRQDLAAQLGASLYEVTKGDASLRVGREALYDGIESIDLQRVALSAQINELEVEAARQAQASSYIRCPTCGMEIHGGDLFCSGCGTPMGARCVRCGAPVSRDDAFCMNCGAKQGAV